MSEELAKGMPENRIMDRHAVNRLVAWVASDEKVKEKLRLELENVAASLAGPSPSPTESILAEVTAVNWLFLRQSEVSYAAAMNSNQSVSLAQSDHSQRRIDRAHRRLMTSLKTLATVRRLALPAIQVNVARQQVNVAGPMLETEGGRQSPVLAVPTSDGNGGETLS